MRHHLSQEHSRTKSRGGHGAEASKTGMDRNTEFSRVGLLGVRMGVQPFMAAR